MSKIYLNGLTALTSNYSRVVDLPAQAAFLLRCENKFRLQLSPNPPPLKTGDTLRVSVVPCLKRNTQADCKGEWHLWVTQKEGHGMRHLGS